jgi:hypothetical protein
MIRRAVPIALLLGGLAWGQELTDGAAQAAKQHILTMAPELKWAGIGWRATYWDGVVDAQKSDKPILLWAMNGHAMACT